MAIPINIGDLLNKNIVESERIEFKENWNPLAAIHTICAFANDINNWGGGYIVLGIKEIKGRPQLPPVGIKSADIDIIQKELLNLCNKLRPVYFPVVEIATYEKKQIIVIWAPGGQNRPYQAPESLGKKTGYTYFVRRFSNTVKARQEEIRELIAISQKIPFDDRINHHADITDLKLPLIKEFLKDTGSSLYEESEKMDFKNLCRQMMIINGGDEVNKPRNVGLLFFNDDPHRFIPYARVEIVQFDAMSNGNVINEKVFTGPLQAQLRACFIYIKNNILKEYIIKMPGKAEALRFYNYPFEAIEEAVVNAFYHRDYEIREPIEVRVTPEKIEIISYPGPDRSISLADINKGKLVARRYRNRRIGEFFKELRFTEGRCTGIPKIFDSMKANGSPKPVFSTDKDRSFFMVTLPSNPFALKEEMKKVRGKKFGVKVRGKSSSVKILELIEENNYITVNELAERIGLTTRAVEKQLARLTAQGFLKKTGPDKKAKREVLKKIDI